MRNTCELQTFPSVTPALLITRHFLCFLRSLVIKTKENIGHVLGKKCGTRTEQQNSKDTTFGCKPEPVLRSKPLVIAVHARCCGQPLPHPPARDRGQLQVASLSK